MKKIVILISIGAIVFSGAFLSLGLLLYSYNNQLLENGIQTEGTVIEIITKQSDGSSEMYSPIVEFPLENGTLQRQELNDSSNPSSYQVGDVVSIVYLADNPSDASISDDFTMTFMPWVFIGIGVFIDIIAIIAILSINNSSKLTGETISSIRTATKEKSIYDKPSDNDNPFLM